MLKQFRIYSIAFLVMRALILVTPTQAASNHKPLYESGVFDLVHVVNALRAAYGLPAYRLNSILMFTAQNQADFMASTGNVTHSGPGGSGLTERLLAAGYPLGGDLSLGGFRAENITSGGQNMTAQDAVDSWMGDSLHQNTMLSADLTEIGAGVAVANGHVYYVMDCAQPSTGGAPPVGATAVGSGSTIPANAAPIYPVVVSTPNPAGDVIHEVKSGQSLWQIAISYNVKIDEIKQQNNLVGNDIYPGDTLFIKREATLSALPQLETVTPEATMTKIPTVPSMPTLLEAVSPTPQPQTAKNNSTMMTVTIVIIALAVLGAGLLTWLGSSTKE